MGQFIDIQWCLHTANLWWGCFEVHAGCDNCYARIFARAKGKAAAWNGDRFAVGSIWVNLAKWQKDAAAAGELHRVFCGSMMDIFEKSLPAFDWNGNPLIWTTGDLRDRYFREMIPATSNLLHLLLTKRPGNARKMVPAEWLEDWPANVMPGASVSDQETADLLIPQLVELPTLPFLSVEPLIGPIDLGRWINCLAWVIVGGESQTGARPCEVAWIRDIVRQCAEAGVPCFVKQVGSRATDAPNGLAGASLKVPTEAAGLISRRLRDSHGGDPSEWPEDLRVREFPAAAAAIALD